MTDWKVLHSRARNDWRTPPAIFRALDSEFGPFDIDVAASADNHLCAAWFSREEDALSLEWKGKCFCNPPYGRGMERWITHAAGEARKGATVVLLAFACTDTAWFQTAWKECAEIRFFTGRLRFLTAAGEQSAPAPKGSCILVFRPDPPTGAPRVSLVPVDRGAP